VFGGRTSNSDAVSHESPKTRTIALEHQGVRAISVRVHKPLTVACNAGTVWLTCERDLRDYVLDAGAAFQARAGDSLVLLGLPVASVNINCQVRRITS
jgi:hypothetical protein